MKVLCSRLTRAARIRREEPLPGCRVDALALTVEEEEERALLLLRVLLLVGWLGGERGGERGVVYIYLGFRVGC
jgi:hypothetical protein